jgi:hypothetical protein
MVLAAGRSRRPGPRLQLHQWRSTGAVLRQRLPAESWQLEAPRLLVEDVRGNGVLARVAGRWGRPPSEGRQQRPPGLPVTSWPGGGGGGTLMGKGARGGGGLLGARSGEDVWLDEGLKGEEQGGCRRWPRGMLLAGDGGSGQPSPCGSRCAMGKRESECFGEKWFGVGAGSEVEQAKHPFCCSSKMN